MALRLANSLALCVWLNLLVSSAIQGDPLIRDEIEAFASVDTSLNPYAFEATELPPNPRFYASVGNGHLAHNLYRDTIYVNGIYNGELGVSHRARIPAYHSSNFSVEDPSCSADPTYLHRLDLENGTFVGTTDFQAVRVTYTVYAHQFYNRLLVTQITLERNSGCGDACCTGEIRILRDDLGSNETESFNMQARQNYTEHGCNSCSMQIGETVESEIPNSNQFTSAAMYWHEIPDVFVLPASENISTFIYVISIDQTDSVAKENFDAALGILAGAEGSAVLLANHTASFRDIWKRGSINVQGDLNLDKVIHGCLYYLYTSLPAHPTFSPNNQFSGLSPGGLPNGANHSVHRDYYGHVFWDMETWMYPPILMFRPDLAKDMLSYRINNMDQAKERAKEGGYEGARFPWESAFTGIEVTPDICVECRENQIHITGDIAYAARQYFSASGDLDWMTTTQAGTNYTGLDFIMEMAKFWNSRPEFNQSTGRYDINGVMPPDEHQQSINNSIYTNVGASYAVHYAQYAACFTNQSHLTHTNWTHIAQLLKFTYHRELRYHEEFEGYQYTVDTNTTGGIGVGIKQADVVMLGFPFLWEMPDDVRNNDLAIYEEVTHPNGPAMTWGIHAVGWLDLKDKIRANGLFNRAYASYAREPFKVWTEVQSGDGAVNFITGMGGFLQAVVFGYGGLRLEVDELRCDAAYLPPNTTELALSSVEYHGTELDFIVHNDSDVTVRVAREGAHLLVLTYNGGVSENMTSGYSRRLSPPYTIKRVVVPACSINKPEIDVDYSPMPASSLSPDPSTTLSPDPSTTLSPDPSTTLSPDPSTTLSPGPSATTDAAVITTGGAGGLDRTSVNVFMQLIIVCLSVVMM